MNPMSQHNILPRNGNFQNVSSNDLLPVYHVFMKEKLNLPHILLHNMINTIQNPNKKSSVPYGMALTKIFNKFKVSLDGEESSFEYSKFTYKNLSHMKQEPVCLPMCLMLTTPMCLILTTKERGNMILHCPHPFQKMSMVWILSLLNVLQ